MPLPAPFRYTAFLSHSHADKAFTHWLHKHIENVAIPTQTHDPVFPANTRLRETGRVFVDIFELGSKDYEEQIRQALASSYWLVVVCSPAAAASPYVNDEIRLFKHLNPGGRITCIAARGEPYAKDPKAPEIVPRAVRFKVDAAGNLTDEPETMGIVANIADGKELAANKVAAVMVGCELDDIHQRFLREEAEAKRAQARVWRNVFAAFGTSVSILAAIAFWNAHLAEQRLKSMTRVTEGIAQNLFTQQTAAGVPTAAARSLIVDAQAELDAAAEGLAARGILIEACASVADGILQGPCSGLLGLFANGIENVFAPGSARDLAISTAKMQIAYAETAFDSADYGSGLIARLGQVEDRLAGLVAAQDADAIRLTANARFVRAAAIIDQLAGRTELTPGDREDIAAANEKLTEAELLLAGRDPFLASRIQRTRASAWFNPDGTPDLARRFEDLASARRNVDRAIAEAGGAALADPCAEAGSGGAGPVIPHAQLSRHRMSIALEEFRSARDLIALDGAMQASFGIGALDPAAIDDMTRRRDSARAELDGLFRDVPYCVAIQPWYRFENARFAFETVFSPVAPPDAEACAAVAGARAVVTALIDRDPLNARWQSLAKRIAAWGSVCPS